MSDNKNQTIALKLRCAVINWEDRLGNKNVLELFGQLRLGLVACCNCEHNPMLHRSLPNTDCDSPSYQAALSLQIELLDFLVLMDDQ